MLSSNSGAPRKHLHSRSAGGGTAGYLARPKLGTVRGVYSTKPLSTRSPSYLTPGGLGSGARKMKYRKTGTGASKIDSFKKRPDPVDTAYREAVGRLKVLLAESYTIPITGKRPLRDESGDETDNQSLLSSRSRHSHHHYHRTSPFISRRYPFYSTQVTPGKYEKSHGHNDYKPSHNDYKPSHTVESERKEIQPEKWEEKKPAPEMVTFIERQEDYIEQLEREAQFCRDELSGLLGKVKEVISENENLHERQKSTLIKSVFDHLETETETDVELELTKSPKKSPKRTRRLEGPSIVFESRISELEAQLTQNKIDLRKCQEENENYKRKIAEGTLGDLTGFDTYKIQIENLQREKGTLQDQISKLQYELAQLRDRNNDTSHKIKRSLDVVEQAQYEKTQLEAEIRRLKDELDRQHDKLRETMHEQGRRISDERAAVERRYSQQIEQLTTELGVQWESTSKLQVELDKQRREDNDVRREVAQKQAHIDELRKEIQAKTAVLQSDLASSSAEKGALEQQIASLHLAVERAERQAKQDSNRLQAEVQSLRQRLDRADADLLHSRRENLRLNEQVASLEKELNMSALLTEEKIKKPIASEPIALPSPTKDRDKEMSSMIKDMESKHVATVAELEGMIHSQNQLMDKLTSECHLLTQKLEDASNRHKDEIRELQTNLNYLSTCVKQQQSHNNQPSYKDEPNYMDNNQRAAPHYTDPSNVTPTRNQPSQRIRTSITDQQIAGSPHHTPIHTNQPPIASRSRTGSNASIHRNTPSPQHVSASPLGTPKYQKAQPELIKRKPSLVAPNIIEEPEYNKVEDNVKLVKRSSKEQLRDPEKKTAENAQNSDYQTTKQEYTASQNPTTQNYSTESISKQSSPSTQNYPQEEPLAQNYPAEQPEYTKQEDYPMDQQYDAQNYPKTDEYPTDQPYQQEYTGDASYPVDQQYTEEPQYAADEQYMPEDQYPADQQYTDDQQYSGEQQYMEQQYTDQQYPSEQQYTDEQYAGQTDYPMEQDYPQEQYAADQQYKEEKPVAKSSPKKIASPDPKGEQQK